VRSLSGTFIDSSQHKAKINDKFEVTTEFLVVDGKIKPKKYKIIVVKKYTEDKDVIGETEIDLAEYGSDHYQSSMLPLSNCPLDANAFLEVALRGRH
jgi:hypothetical protein